MKIRKMISSLGKLILLSALGSLGLAGCAYNEVMGERRSENQMLKQQLQAEEERGQRLQR